MALIAITFSCISWSCRNNAQPAVTFDPSRTHELEQYGSSLISELPIPGISMIVINGDSLFYHTFGSRSLADSINSPLFETTPIFTGNISPIMVITGIFKLAAEGKIDLNDPVTKYLPEFALGNSDVSGITIEHLMGQTAGIPYHESIWDKPDFSPQALSRTTQSIRLQPAEFSPAGSRVKRSPYNFDILADLISKVSHMEFEDYMQSHILKPLGMNDSFFPKDDKFKYKVAQPHQISNAITYAIDTIDLYPTNREHAGSIGFHGSTKDLASWIYMLLHQGSTVNSEIFLPRKWTELMFTSLPIDKNTAVGYGWEISSSKHGNIFEQYHTMGGFSAHIALVPDKKMGIVLLSNLTSNLDLRSISAKLMYWLSSSENKLPKEQPLLAQTLGKEFSRTQQVSKVIALYDSLKLNKPDLYDYKLESLSQFGVNLLYHSRDSKTAIDFFKECIDRFPSNAEAHLNLAEAFLVDHQYNKCKPVLIQAKELLSKDKTAAGSIYERIAILENAIGKHQ